MITRTSATRFRVVRALWTRSSYLVVLGCSVLSENELPDFKNTVGRVDTFHIHTCSAGME
jgi:hypothetical protein